MTPVVIPDVWSRSAVELVRDALYKSVSGWHGLACWIYAYYGGGLPHHRQCQLRLCLLLLFSLGSMHSSTTCGTRNIDDVETNIWTLYHVPSTTLREIGGEYRQPSFLVPLLVCMFLLTPNQHGISL